MINQLISANTPVSEILLPVSESLPVFHNMHWVNHRKQPMLPMGSPEP